jgi:hypothetical protein
MNLQPDWSKWKCRCSGINAMMITARGSEPLTDKQWETVKELGAKMDSGKATDKQKLEYARLLQKNEDSKTVVLGDSAVAYLLECYAWETQGMKSITKEFHVESFERGRKTEPESIELLSFVDNYPYKKNEERLSNDFLTGIKDVYRGDDHRRPKAIGDIKSCGDYPTFLYKIHKGLDAGVTEQIAGYGDIDQCGDLFAAFTLPNMPESMRQGYKFRLASKLDVIDVDHTPEWKEMERSMIFDSIPHEKRVFKIPVDPFTIPEQQAVYERVKHCRDWLNNFHEMYQKLNK